MNLFSRKKECADWARMESVIRANENQGQTKGLHEERLSIVEVNRLFTAIKNKYIVVNGEVLTDANGNPMMMSAQEAQDTRKQLIKKDMLLKVDII